MWKLIIRGKTNELFPKQTWDPENVKFPPDCNCVVNHDFTHIVRPWFTTTTFESHRPTNRIADWGLNMLQVMEDNWIDAGAKYKGWASGFGGPLLGCFLRKSWIGVCPKFAIWSSIADLCNGSSSILSKSTAPS